MKWTCKCGWFGDREEARVIERKPQPAGFKQDGHTMGSTRIACAKCSGDGWLRPMLKAERIAAEAA